MREPLLVTTTVERQEDAENIARSLLTKRLVACAQIQGPMKSLFWWKDDITEAVEFSLTVKTFAELYGEVERLVLAQHPYDVPEIIAEKMIHVAPAYQAWMEQEIDNG